MLIILVLVFIAGAGFFILKRFFPYPPISPLKRQCPVLEIKKETVRGDSLRPIIEPNQEVVILYNYYSCFDIKRDDIIAYNYAGQENPIIKFVKGLPGDKFYLKKQGSTERWSIMINDEPVKNSEANAYSLPKEKYQMLYLYARDYDTTIPPDSYLILGNSTLGSLDSTRFGLVHKTDILGKVVE